MKCQDNVDSKTANIDYYAELTQRTGDFHCFCKNLFTSGDISSLNFLFPLDKKSHCEEWFEKYQQSENAIGYISGLIISATLVVEIFVYNASKLTRTVDQQAQINSAIRPLTWILFLNVGLSIFVVDLSSHINSSSIFDGI